MELGLGAERVEMQEPHDLARPLGHEKERIRRPLAALDARNECRRQVRLEHRGLHDGWIEEAGVLRRNRLPPNRCDGISVADGCIPDKDVSRGRHFRAGLPGRAALCRRYTPHRSINYSLEEYMSSNLPELTTTSYAILGLLSINPWSTYELAKQMQRDRFVWPRAESNLYAEPKRLVAHGFASAHSEPRGRRRRTVYSITPSGRQALADWLGTPAAEPRWEAESMVKFTFATGGTKEQLLKNLCDFRQHATARWKAVEAIFRPYLEGNEPFPDRTHIN
ncbi:MAG: PadR family transcriptional regulator, partial [Gaiellaceae bacterium]